MFQATIFYMPTRVYSHFYMISCPEFTLQPILYDTVLPYLSAITIILNPYVIYCIIWRSTPHMKTYRWFLLFHQVMTFLTDISIGFLAKPVIFLPLPAGYPAGYLKGVLPTKVLLGMFMLLVEVSFGSILYLFAYRYETVKGTKRIFAPYLIAMTIPGSIVSLIPSISIFLADQKDPAVIEEFRKSYSCVTEEIVSLEDIVFYSYVSTALFAALPLGLLCILFTAVDVTLLYWSYKETNIVIMSQKLKRIQRRFLLQVTLQAFIPLLFVSIPVFATVIAFGFGIFGIAYLTDMVVVTLSGFGSIGAIILIAMNPTYYNWIYRFSSSKRVATISSFIDKPEQLPKSRVK